MRSRTTAAVVTLALVAAAVGSQAAGITFKTGAWWSLLPEFALLPAPAIVLLTRRPRTPEPQRSGQPWSAPPRPFRVLLPAGATLAIPRRPAPRPRRRRRLAFRRSS